MDDLPISISLLFASTSCFTIVFFYKATGYSKISLFIILAMMVIQAAIALTGFFTVTETYPPRVILLLIPPFLLIVGLFISVNGRMFLDMLDLKILTLLHLIRIPVELVLFFLFIYKKVPELMTFEGRNYDILSGLTAPIIYYFGFIHNKINKKLLITWNLCCLLLLANIVIHAILSVPFPFQQFAFEQPNIAVLYFPFIWLPGIVVPLVLLSHLAAIRQLIKTDPVK